MKTKDFSKHENQDKLWQKVDPKSKSNTKYENEKQEQSMENKKLK